MTRIGIVAERPGETRVAGALLGESQPRIVRINDFRVDMVPRGTLLVLQNQDVPGVIGRVGTLLGNAGVNIAGYHQSRLDAGGDAALMPPGLGRVRGLGKAAHRILVADGPHHPDGIGDILDLGGQRLRAG